MNERADPNTTSRGLPFGLAVRAIVRDKEGRCLLLRRSKSNKTNAGIWEFPGGKTEPGESFADALVREVKEECGLEVIPTRAVGAVQTEMPHIHVVHLLMEARLVSGTVCLSREHDDSTWVPVRDLADLNMIKQFRASVVTYAANATLRTAH